MLNAMSAIPLNTFIVETIREHEQSQMGVDDSGNLSNERQNSVR